ncbi:unnamed protein product [Amoebophrya sp. A120]|nr:unnamed protein product [Amoebophrya sp. A120]|eukprot:GSA120T00019415001.1
MKISFTSWNLRFRILLNEHQSDQNHLVISLPVAKMVAKAGSKAAKKSSKKVAQKGRASKSSASQGAATTIRGAGATASSKKLTKQTSKSSSATSTAFDDEDEDMLELQHLPHFNDLVDMNNLEQNSDAQDDEQDEIDLEGFVVDDEQTASQPRRSWRFNVREYDGTRTVVVDFGGANKSPADELAAREKKAAKKAEKKKMKAMKMKSKGAASTAGRANKGNNKKTVTCDSDSDDLEQDSDEDDLGKEEEEAEAIEFGVGDAILYTQLVQPSDPDCNGKNSSSSTVSFNDLYLNPRDSEKVQLGFVMGFVSAGSTSDDEMEDLHASKSSKRKSSKAFSTRTKEKKKNAKNHDAKSTSDNGKSDLFIKVRRFAHSGQLNKLFTTKKEKDAFEMHDQELIFTEWEEVVSFHQVENTCVIYSAEEFFDDKTPDGAIAETADVLLEFFCRRGFTESSQRRGFPDLEWNTVSEQIVKHLREMSDTASTGDTALQAGAGTSSSKSGNKDRSKKTNTTKEHKKLKVLTKVFADDHDEMSDDSDTEEDEADNFSYLDKIYNNEKQMKQLFPTWFQRMMEARKQLLPSSIPEVLPCREKEKEEIYAFLRMALESGDYDHNKVMFIAGLPGTGKTAIVSEILNEMASSSTSSSSASSSSSNAGIKNTSSSAGILCASSPAREQPLGGNNSSLLKNTFRAAGGGPSNSVFSMPGNRIMRCNCLKLFGTYSLYLEMLMHLQQLKKRPLPKKALSLLEKAFLKYSTRKEKLILFLDELDALKQNLLYRVLEWTLKFPNLILITISNTLNLPEKLAPRVYSRLRPKRLQIQPYSYAQLREIIQKRLDTLKCFQPNTIELCAVRIAAETGDVRKALQVCRASVDYKMLENKKRMREQLEILENKEHEDDEGESEINNNKSKQVEKSSVEILKLDKEKNLLQKYLKAENKRPNDVFQITLTDMNHVESGILRSNYKLQLIEQLPVNVRWFLVAFVHELEQSFNTSNANRTNGNALDMEDASSLATTILAIRSQMTGSLNDLSLDKSIQTFNHPLLNFSESGNKFHSACESYFPYEACVHYLKYLEKIGVLEHLDGSKSSSALKQAAKITSSTPARSIYDQGALDVVRLASDLQIEDIRYALTRAKCPIGKILLKLIIE